MWTNDLCKVLAREGYAGERLTVMFGGPHQSLPSLRAGVRPGDVIHPVRVFRRRMWVLGAMEVGRVLDHDTVGEELPMEDHLRLIRWKPPKAGCVSEVVVGPPGSPLTFERPVPPGLPARLTYRSRRGERQVKHVVDGELRSAVSVHGIYRPAPESAAELKELVRESHTA
ncbi:hypothetical protein BU52_18445 [Streptomyces toyocaensis]|uniref:Uncharacterized protein n=1 Tax=Streptomyces toyocaensis TaxID=55952 RepID=A0A081XQG2_STRTO|nr:hypothetical protein [Streptomyces toyocaensis]KES05785.1 hypothetical protein BU52_18445 [Streptomyces toyocaensis]